MPKRIWKDIPWYEWIYKVSNYWEVLSLTWKSWIKEKILKAKSNQDWYKRVNLYRNKKYKHYRVHRLVMLAFIWESDLQVNHKDWDKSNNKLNNLEYVTASENVRHAFRTWLMQGYRWALHPQSKKVNQYTLDGRFIKTWDCLRDIQRALWIANQNISSACRGKSKSSCWYKWKFALITH